MTTLMTGVIETGKNGLTGSKTKLISNRDVSTKIRSKVKASSLRLRTGSNLRPNLVKMRKMRKFMRRRRRNSKSRKRRTRRKSNANKERKKEKLSKK